MGRPTPRSLRVPLVVLLRPPPSPLRHPIQTLPRRAAHPALPLPAPPTATATTVTATAALLLQPPRRTAPLRALRPALLLTLAAPTQAPPTSTWHPPALSASVRSSPPSCKERDEHGKVSGGQNTIRIGLGIQRVSALSAWGFDDYVLI